MAKSSSIIFFFVADVWRNPTAQLGFLLAKVAKAAAVVADDDGILKPGEIWRRYGETRT